ncbi:MAG: DNA-processing protein DprA [Verrucomicrobiota bacterium]
MPLSSTDAYLALNLLPKIGPVRVRRLIRAFSTPTRILTASTQQLETVEGIGRDIAATIHRWENHVDLELEKKRLRDHNIGVITQDSPSYPKYLSQIYDPPFLLYIKGQLLPRDQTALGVVGSRRATHYGLQTARKLSFQLAHAGVTIVSGLARGIDTAAHEGALAAKGRTIAVLGSGIANVYPAENQPLAEKIAASGAILSEFPPLYVPDKQSFPLRNRIVSGMSLGILVVEAPGRSGSLITANQALDQGRNVYAIPGPIDRPSSEGTNRLIQQGAKLILNGDDVLEDIDSLFPLDPVTAAERPAREESHLRGLDTLSEEEKSLYEAIDDTETQIDTLIQRTGLPAATVSANLLRLEMKRLVKQLPGNFFIKLI